MVLAHILAYIKFRYWYHWKYMKRVDFTGTKTKQIMKLEFFCDLERVVDILISLPLYWIWSLHVHGSTRKIQRVFRTYRYMLQSTSMSAKSLLLYCYLIQKFKVMMWPNCEGQHFVNSLMSHYSVNANMVV